MQLKERKLKGVFEVQLESREDERGFFMRVYDDEIFKKHGIHRNWVQENHSLSIDKGIIRGMHFQFPPHSETKLVRAVGGEIYDVFIDIRKNSPTFGQWDSIILSADNKKMIYIPRGFAHGFCTLSKDCEILYKVDNYYTPGSEGTIRWDDPSLEIDWPVNNPILSEKDSKSKGFKEFCKIHDGLNI